MIKTKVMQGLVGGPPTSLQITEPPLVRSEWRKLRLAGAVNWPRRFQNPCVPYNCELFAHHLHGR